MTEPINCVEFETILDLNLVYATQAHCCKFKNIQITHKNHLAEFKELGYKFFQNNSHTVHVRNELAAGRRPERCSDCWEHEDKGIESWRMMKNKLRDDNPPISINLQLSSLCNHACFYCVPNLSSTIQKFKSWFNPLTESVTETNIHENKHIITLGHVKEYIENLPIENKVLSMGMTGGEPFITDEFYDHFESLILAFCSKDPSRKFQFEISTNTNVKVENLNRFYETISRLKEKFNVKVVIITSVENLEERAEYVRYGLNWNNFIENFKIHNKNADSHKIRLTVNPFTLVNLTDFFIYFDNYNVTEYLYNYPYQKYWRINILDQRFSKELERLEAYIKTSRQEEKFREFKLYNSMLQNDVENAKTFKTAITALDKIRSTNWRVVFPEYQEWFDNIQ